MTLPTFYRRIATSGSFSQSQQWYGSGTLILSRRLRNACSMHPEISLHKQRKKEVPVFMTTGTKISCTHVHWTKLEMEGGEQLLSKRNNRLLLNRTDNNRPQTKRIWRHRTPVQRRLLYQEQTEPNPWRAETGTSTVEEANKQCRYYTAHRAELSYFCISLNIHHVEKYSQ